MQHIAWLVLVLAVCRTSLAITGSSPTTIEKHPYTVVIDRVIPVYDDTDIIDYDISMMCAGALLSEKTVIVTASCFKDVDDIMNMTNVRVRVGAQLREGGGEAFGVSTFLVHPLWVSLFPYNNDVMLLYLVDAVPFRAEVQPVALAPPNAPSAGEKLLMTGYGDLTLDEVLVDGETRQIQVVTLPFVNQDVCKASFYLFYPSTTVSCAGGVHAGTCGWRDVGSPLVNWRGELVGLATLLPHLNPDDPDDPDNQKYMCGVPGKPTTFTNLALPTINKWVRANVDVEPRPDDVDSKAVSGRNKPDTRR